MNSDRVEVSADLTTHTDTASDTSLSEQQTSVALKESVEASGHAELPTYKADAEEKSLHTEMGNHAAPSSGENSDVQNPKFPELVNAVAQAVNLAPSSSLPASLKDAIAQFPDRVQPAIAYLQHQRQRRSLQNPMGYLYKAITVGWDLIISEPSVTPFGFNKWFEWAKMQGWVIAATAIDNVHHTLHVQRGWLPTEQIMQEYSIMPLT